MGPREAHRLAGGCIEEGVAQLHPDYIRAALLWGLEVESCKSATVRVLEPVERSRLGVLRDVADLKVDDTAVEHSDVPKA